MPWIRNSLAAALIASIGLLLPGNLYGGSKVRVGKRIEASKRVSIDEIDHSTWDRLLRRYVDSKGNVDYRAWKNEARDRQLLTNYLRGLATADPSKPAQPKSKLAFWINAYNALTVHGILREYPTTSIRNHTAKLIGYNIWHDLLLQVGDKTYSLDAIEHQVLRKMGEPRIHFAIVCASKGCPRLLAEAYVSETLEAQLQTNTEHFFLQRQNFRFDARTSTFKLSSILKWFRADFGESDTRILRWISPYLPTEASRRVAATGKGGIEFLAYDWNLNDQSDSSR